MTYHEAAELDARAKRTQVTILLHCAGLEAQEIHQHFEFTEAEIDKSDNWEHVLKKFSNYCKPRKNQCFERYKFWKREIKRKVKVLITG